MSALSVLSRVFGPSAATAYGRRPGLPALQAGSVVDSARPHRELYSLLRAYYLSNGLYDDNATALYASGVFREALKPLRNPTYRVVEFYVARVWPGTLPDALPIEADNPALAPAIEQVWQWSNWAAQKQVFVRWLAMYGDVFCKVAQRPDGGRVYFQLVDPRHVSALDTDERGYLTYLRLDVPQAQRDGDTVRQVTHTEVWDKARGSMRRWTHTRGEAPDLDQLGAPDEETWLAEYGIDFLPWVQCQFRDVGEPRGMAAVTHALDKIDEANRQATRLHQMLFRNNRSTWALEGEGMRAGDTRPLPPPRVAGWSGSSNASDGTVTVGEDQLVSLPGGWRLRSLVPELDYAAALNVVAAQMRELEDDLPELLMVRLRDLGANVSGRAVRLHLTAAIDNVLEVRGNCEAALIRLHEMALTIGQQAGLFPALGGTYASGAFQHRIATRDVLPADALEEAQTEQAAATAKLAKLQVGVSPQQALRELGYDEQEIAQMAAERETTAADSADRLLAALERDASPQEAGAATEGEGAPGPTAAMLRAMLDSRNGAARA